MDAWFVDGMGSVDADAPVWRRDASTQPNVARVSAAGRIVGHLASGGGQGQVLGEPGVE